MFRNSGVFRCARNMHDCLVSSHRHFAAVSLFQAAWTEQKNKLFQENGAHCEKTITRPKFVRDLGFGPVKLSIESYAISRQWDFIK